MAGESQAGTFEFTLLALGTWPFGGSRGGDGSLATLTGTLHEGLSFLCFVLRF